MGGAYCPSQKNRRNGPPFVDFGGVVDKKPSMGQLRTIAGRYLSAIIPAFLIISVGVNFHLSRTYSHKDMENNYLINLAGRQRMLGQEVMIEYLQAEKFHRTLSDEKPLRFIDSAHTLLYGGEIVYNFTDNTKVTVPPAPSKEIADLLSKQIILMSQLRSPLALERPEQFKIIHQEIIDTANFTVQKWDEQSSLQIREMALHRQYLFFFNIILSLAAAAILIRYISVSNQMKSINENVIQTAKSKTNFFASVSHEIRNPLNVVTAMPDLLAATPLNPEQAKYVDTLRHTSHRLLNLINDLLDFSRLESGNIQLFNEPFEVLPFIERIATTAKIKADEKDLRFELHFDPSIPKFLIGDSLRIGQVLDNFISNAIRFTDVGAIKLWIRRLEQHGAKERISFEVSDTGVGIDPEDQKKLFDPFFQVGKAMREKRGGTGLGLAICQHIVQSMGGSIRVDSRRNFGSRFSIVLELEVARASSGPKPDNIKPSEEGEIKILAVDDCVDNLMVVSGLLSPYSNMKVTHANCGEIALAKIKNENFDLILMDIQMPMMDGVDAARRIQTWQMSHNQKLTPIIALTAGTSKDLSSFICRLDKPINQNSLIATINSVL